MSKSNLTPEERIIKAKIRLTDDPPEGRPFFSFLVSHMKFIEKAGIGTMAVNDNGECFYDPKFIDGLTDEEIIGGITHETMHVVLEHCTIGMEMRWNRELSNIAMDIIVNNIISADNIKLPPVCGQLTPKNNEIDVYGCHIKDVDIKSSGEIYDELYKHFKKQLDDFLKQAGKSRFDDHIQSEGEGKDGEQKEGSGLGRENLDKKDWKKVLLDAMAKARERGCVPAGMERVIGKIMELKVDWRHQLFRYITSMIPVDYSWARPSRKTISTGVYLPDTEKEQIEIISAIDTSGSISDEELRTFLEELVGITRTFRNVDLTILDCDADIHGIHQFRHANVDDITTKVKLKGGGGTSHKPVFRWLKKNRPQAKFIVCFTDGYTDFPSKSEVKGLNTIWVVAGENRLEKERFPFGNVVVVK